MKRLRDLQKGDTIWVKCPEDVEHWTTEIVTNIHMGEDGYPGSKQWYLHIQTDKSMMQCSDEDARNGKHWPILIAFLGSQVQDTSKASNNVNMLVSAVDQVKIEEEKLSLIDIIKESKIVDLRKMEELPQEAYIVGMNNNN